MIEIENRKMEESIKQNADFLKNFKKEILLPNLQK